MKFGNISLYGLLSNSSGNKLPNKLYDASGNLVADFTWSSGTTKTITLTTSDTDTTITNKLYTYGKYIPWGATLRFQFPNGTISFSNPVYFKDFWGGGTLEIIGDSPSNTLHTSQTSIISTSGSGMYFKNCDCNISVQSLKIETSASSAYLIYVINCWKRTAISGCWLRATSKSNQYGAFFNTGNIGGIETTYFGNLYAAIYNQIFSTQSSDNQNYTSGGDTACSYGLYCGAQGLLFKANTQPTGCTIANEYTVNGGQIFS